jgi:CheY-like chemotaxis protein
MGIEKNKNIVNPGDYSVLLAEDNPDDIIITQRAWKKGLIKNELYVVKDGEEALDFLYRKGKYLDAPRPSLMLLDLKMPKVDGFEVLKTMKGDDSLKKMPIIVLTTSNRHEDVNRAYEMGCNAYIVKPVSFDNFIKAVAEIQRFWLILCEIPT